MTEKINDTLREGLLMGDSVAIVAIGQLYLGSMGLPLIPVSHLGAFLKGSPDYLNPIGKGWGMSTDDAIRCLFDVERTSAFIKAIVQAARSLKQLGTNHLTAVEAGCGTGILALAMAYAGVEQVFGVEINPATARTTKNFLEVFGMADRLQIIQGDATNFDPQGPVDIIVSENMHTGLFFEPQFQIISNLRRFLRRGGIILPHGVKLSFTGALTNWEGVGKNHAELRKIDPNHIIPIGKTSWLPEIDLGEDANEVIDGSLSLTPQEVINSLIVGMEVVVDGQITLNSGQAEFLGQPHVVKVKQFAGNSSGGGFFSYKKGGNPPTEVYERE